MFHTINGKTVYIVDYLPCFRTPNDSLYHNKEEIERVFREVRELLIKNDVTFIIGEHEYKFKE